MLLLLLLLGATQLLLLGGSQLGPVLDAAPLEAYQQALPQGKKQALAAVERAVKGGLAGFIINVSWHQALGSLLGLLVGVAAALYLSWRRKATWWLLPLLLLGTFGASAMGIPSLLRAVTLNFLHHCFGALALQWSLLATGGVLVAGALLMLLGASRLARR